MSVDFNIYTVDVYFKINMFYGMHGAKKSIQGKS